MIARGIVCRGSLTSSAAVDIASRPNVGEEDGARGQADTRDAGAVAESLKRSALNAVKAMADENHQHAELDHHHHRVGLRGLTGPADRSGRHTSPPGQWPAR